MPDPVSQSTDPEEQSSGILHVPEAPSWLQIRHLGRMPYSEALSLQRSLQKEVQERRDESAGTGYLLLLEHDPPVVTVSRRPGAAKNVLAGPEVLARHGIERRETDRGGDVTYHGPGQLVAYAIVDLDRIGLRIHAWIRLLEQAIIDTLGDFGLTAGRDSGATGVWVGRRTDDADGIGGRKIAAIGVRVSRWVSMHGLALNVDPDLNHFGLIVPCGLVVRPVTSVAAELDDGSGLSMNVVRQRLATRLGDAISIAERAASNADA